jgi:hypothetical protein
MQTVILIGRHIIMPTIPLRYVDPTGMDGEEPCGTPGAPCTEPIVVEATRLPSRGISLNEMRKIPGGLAALYSTIAAEVIEETVYPAPRLYSSCCKS